MQAPVAAQAVTIVPHRAIYDMELARGGDSDVADVEGTMLFEWTDSCDGWTVTQRTHLMYLQSTGDETEVSYNYTAWESKDGLRYRFFIRRLENDELVSELRGDARLDGPGGAGTATYTLPEEKTLPLPAGTLFPTAHSLKLIEHAQGGQQLLFVSMFDGSDEEGLWEVSAVIGPQRPPKASGAAVSPLLAAGRSWNVSLAFYKVGTQEAQPEHEQFATVHDNGVVEDLTIDYGQFTVDARLRKIEPLKPPQC